jgi:hypothetical protein
MRARSRRLFVTTIIISSFLPFLTYIYIYLLSFSCHLTGATFRRVSAIHQGSPSSNKSSHHPAITEEEEGALE